MSVCYVPFKLQYMSSMLEPQYPFIFMHFFENSSFILPQERILYPTCLSYFYKKNINVLPDIVTTQRKGMGQLEYQVMPSFRDEAHDCVLCTFNNKSASNQDKWCGP
jgi:hypothetical protein